MKRKARGGLWAGLGLCAAGLASLLGAAEPEDTTRELRYRALHSELAWELLESLTTEVGPRFAGTPGDAAARAWALGKLAELGFPEARVDPVTVPRWVRGEAEARTVSPFPQPLVIAALGPSAPTPEAGLEAEVLRVESVADLEARSPREVAGRIVFLDQRLDRRHDLSGYREVAGIRSTGPRVASEKGAVGALVRSLSTSNHRIPHTGGVRFSEAEPIPAAALAPPDADLLARQLERGPVRVYLRLTCYRDEDVESGNVIAELPGREHPEEIVLLGAHLDSWDLGTGAIDDGAGVAIAMAVLKMLAGLPEPPRRTVRIALFANEEMGLSGGRAYAERYENEKGRHKVAMEPDFGAGRVFRLRSRAHPDDLSKVQAIHAELDPLGIAWSDIDTTGGPDLRYLRDWGMAFLEPEQDGWGYFDLHHSADDTLDKVDPEALAQNLAAYLVATYLAAELEDPWRSTAPAP